MLKKDIKVKNINNMIYRIIIPRSRKIYEEYDEIHEVEAKTGKEALNEVLKGDNRYFKEEIVNNKEIQYEHEINHLTIKIQEITDTTIK